jgi:hypothetical protein
MMRLCLAIFSALHPSCRGAKRRIAALPLPSAAAAARSRPPRPLVAIAVSVETFAKALGRVMLR